MTRVLVADERGCTGRYSWSRSASAVRASEVILADPASLDRMAERFEPDVVVCSRITSLVQEIAVSWVQVTANDRLEAEVIVGGRHSAISDLGIEDLLAVVDETEGLLTLRGQGEPRLPPGLRFSLTGARRSKRHRWARARRRITWYTKDFGDLSGRGEVPDSSSYGTLGRSDVSSTLRGRPLLPRRWAGTGAFPYCSSLGRVTSSQTT